MKKIIIIAITILIIFTYSQAVNITFSMPNLGLDFLRGLSGKLKIILRMPNSTVFPGASLKFRNPADTVISQFPSALDQTINVLEDLWLITLVPFSAKQDGRIGKYILGNWPYEQVKTVLSPAYANPDGFIEVTLENRNLQVSEHFKLGDFLTKDQPNIWPKYMLLSPSLIDKLELIIDQLEWEGCVVNHMEIMSGFRTPRYNKEGGNTGGRGMLSRHMYGDAADIFVDNDRDGWTDDINGDGRVDIRDARFMAKAAERIEARYPSLVGGIGIYPACCGHGPFIHVDVRGKKARW
ncbi:MAG: hypothetical protein MUF15_07415 [Acidobacteria bacterium]|jgi:uncharacterized protein YcbK (DUF882 family)|nr:hypothetical protein [Acidobacteriota bacterium]